MLEQLKANLIKEDNADDNLLREILAAAVDYAESVQHLGEGYYTEHAMSSSTRQAVIMLASHWYESRDGGTGGFFQNTPAAADSVRKAVDDLLKCKKNWEV